MYLLINISEKEGEIKMDYEITQHYAITGNTLEFKIRIEESKVLVIFGRHINGYYIALPGLYICCEATDPDCVEKNKTYLSQAGLRSDYALIICEGIKEYWEKIDG